MGTKNNPGQYDCHAAAAPDEPLFTLLGRDRHAAGLVRLWALLRARDGEDEAKVAEALKCADDMDQHALKLRKIVNVAEAGKPFEALYLALTEGMAEHPDGFDHPCQCQLCLSYGE